jgi:hypothetical protein
MRKFLITTAALLALAGTVHAEDTPHVPNSIVGQDWCFHQQRDEKGQPIPKSSFEIYLPVAGCKSLVFKKDTVTWDTPDEQASCSITAIVPEEDGPGTGTIRGICQSRNGGSYALYARVHQRRQGCLPLLGEERCLIVIRTPGIPGAVAPKTTH